MFEKMAQSLAATGQYEIHIIGYPSHLIPSYPGIKFHPSRPFKRLSAYRLLIPLLDLVKGIRLKPSVVVITTHELLFFAWMLRIITGSKTVYDVRENYMRNILFLPTFSIFVRPFLAAYVRIKEVINAPFVSLFVLSDYGYEDEMTFMKKKSIIIENKVKRNAIQDRNVKPADPDIKLLFSGTLAESTGVFTAIELAKQLHAVDSRITLSIVGYCAQASILKQIQAAIENHDFIQLEGGNQLAPHGRIMEAISQSNFGIIAYPPNPSTSNTMPTKLYEYIGSRLPILLIDYKLWVDKCVLYPAAITFNPEHYVAEDILHKMIITEFYAKPPGADIFWENEAHRFIAEIARLICD